MVAPPRWGDKMMTKFLTTALGIAIVLVPMNAQCSQPGVKLSDLQPQAQGLTAQPGFGFFLDPDAEVELRIQMPRSINELDIGRDPFAVARV